MVTCLGPLFFSESKTAGRLLEFYQTASTAGKGSPAAHAQTRASLRPPTWKHACGCASDLSRGPSVPCLLKYLYFPLLVFNHIYHYWKLYTYIHISRGLKQMEAVWRLLQLLDRHPVRWFLISFFGGGFPLTSTHQSCPFFPTSTREYGFRCCFPSRLRSSSQPDRLDTARL